MWIIRTSTQESPAVAAHEPTIWTCDWGANWKWGALGGTWLASAVVRQWVNRHRLTRWSVGEPPVWTCDWRANLDLGECVGAWRQSCRVGKLRVAHWTGWRCDTLTRRWLGTARLARLTGLKKCHRATGKRSGRTSIEMKEDLLLTANQIRQPPSIDGEYTERYTCEAENGTTCRFSVTKIGEPGSWEWWHSRPPIAHAKGGCWRTAQQKWGRVR